MIRGFALALALLATAACGRYGPPVRSPGQPTAATPAVSAPASPGDTEECPDPNAPGQDSGQAP